MSAQQVPQCKQRRVTYLLSYIHVRNPVWIETTVCLYLLYICHPVIHRELQNVVYMNKKSMFKKKGEVPVQKYLWFQLVITLPFNNWSGTSYGYIYAINSLL
jgi:hypothetical protein